MNIHNSKRVLRSNSVRPPCVSSVHVRLFVRPLSSISASVSPISSHSNQSPTISRRFKNFKRTEMNPFHCKAGVPKAFHSLTTFSSHQINTLSARQNLQVQPHNATKKTNFHSSSHSFLLQPKPESTLVTRPSSTLRAEATVRFDHLKKRNQSLSAGASFAKNRFFSGSKIALADQPNTHDRRDASPASDHTGNQINIDHLNPNSFWLFLIGLAGGGLIIFAYDKSRQTRDLQADKAFFANQREQLQDLESRVRSIETRYKIFKDEFDRNFKILFKDNIREFERSEDPALDFQISDQIKSWMIETGTPGVVCAISKNGKIIFNRGFGLADVENDLPMKESAPLRCASISKAITSVALGILMERGEIDIDQPVSAILEDFPTTGDKDLITPRFLASHQSGIRHYKGKEFESKRHFSDIKSARNIFQDDALLFRPGEDYTYTTYGFTVLSEVIEKIAKKPFLQFLQENIFTPLDMHSTTGETSITLMKNRPRYYRRNGTALENAPYVDVSNKWAGGGLRATAEDLVRFGNGLLQGQIVQPQTVQKLWTRQILPSGKDTKYGLGWEIHTAEEVSKKFKTTEIVSHSGGACGGTTQLVLFPEDKVVVSILANLEKAPRTFLLATKLGEIANEKKLSEK